jgi:cytochrome c5
MTQTRLLSLLAVLALPLAGCGDNKSIDGEMSAQLTQPVARVELAIAKVAPGSRTGEQIYTSVCAACHGSGVLEAPKTGDKAAWAPRLAMGLDGLVASANAGKGAMPPKGGASDLTDKELVRAVAYLANQAGASFTEPPVEGN